MRKFAMESLLLGVDIGTTATKAVLTDSRGKVISQGRADHPTQHLQATWVEQAPLDWWNSFCLATNQALELLDGRRISGLAISSQAPTLIAVDSSGVPVRPAMIWMDRRSEKQAQALGQALPNIFELTGNRSDPFYLASKLSWFIQNEPELYSKTKYFLQIPGFLNFKLTGVFGLDKPHASLLQLLNANQNGWNDEVIEMVGIDINKFPEIGECTRLLGEVKESASKVSGIPIGTPVYFGSVDGSAAALEAGAIDPGVVAEMTGTSTVLLIPTDGKIRDQSFISMSHSVPERHLQLGAMVASGASVQWFQEVVLGNKIALEELIEGAAKVKPGCDGLIFLPYMVGERAPIWDSDARGVFFGLTLTSTPFAMFRAILEGTAFALAHNVETARSAGFIINEIRSVGGGSKNALWNQIKSDVLGIPILTLADSPGAPIGDALIAGVGAGIIDDLREVIASSIVIKEHYLPNKATHVYYQSRYSIFKGLYLSLKQNFADSASTATFGTAI